MLQAQHDKEESSVNQPPLQRSVPNLESLLRERLQKKAGDEEVQDLARAILRHLTSVTGVSRPSAAASSPEVSIHSAFLLSVLRLISFEGECSLDGAIRGCRPFPLSCSQRRRG